MKPQQVLKTRRSLPSIHDALVWADLPALEAEILLAEATGVDRTNLFAHPEIKLSQTDWEKFQDFVNRRRVDEPIAYIVGYKEFYGLKLTTDRRALIPRQETETLVLEAIKFNPKVVADVGTGAGPIALALAKHLPEAKIYASDISAEALKLAHDNADALGLFERITFLRGSLLDPIPEPVDLITANLPYVRGYWFEELPNEIKNYEPRIALEGGDNGMFWYDQLFAQAKDKLLPKGEILYELDGRILVWTPN